MLIAIAAALLAGAYGVHSALKRNGTLLDTVQYAAAHAMVGGIIGTFITVFISRST
jgi:hypothetical protein